MSSRSAQDTLFRHSAAGREPLAPPGQGGTHVHVRISHQRGIGAITSCRGDGRGPAVRTRMTDLEWLAVQANTTVAEILRRR